MRCHSTTLHVVHTHIGLHTPTHTLTHERTHTRLTLPHTRTHTRTRGFSPPLSNLLPVWELSSSRVEIKQAAAAPLRSASSSSSSHHLLRLFLRLRSLSQPGDQPQSVRAARTHQRPREGRQEGETAPTGGASSCHIPNNSHHTPVSPRCRARSRSRSPAQQPAAAAAAALGGSVGRWVVPLPACLSGAPLSSLREPCNKKSRLWRHTM